MVGQNNRNQIDGSRQAGKEGFSAGDEHLLGEFARAGEVGLALQKETDIGRLDVEFLGNALHVAAVAGKPGSRSSIRGESTVSGAGWR